MNAIEKANASLGPIVERQQQRRCPFEEHEDRHASATFYEDHFYCHACGRGGDALDLYCILNGLPIKQALVRLGASTGAPYKPTPVPRATKDFAEAFVTKLIDRPEYALAKKWAQDIKRYDIPEETTLQCLTDQTFLDACRHKGFNPLLVHDLLFMEVA